MRLRKRKSACVVCDASVHAFVEAISCDLCSKWTHVKCTYGKVTRAMYSKALKGDNLKFMCVECVPLSRNRPYYESTRLDINM